MRAEPVVCAALLWVAGCDAQIQEVPEGALAVVGDVVIGPEELGATLATLEAYGQARYRGPEGQRALLQSMIQQELLVQAAREAGFEDDPRVEWAVTEEMAALYVSAELERRLPRSEVAEDEAALEQWLAARGDEVSEPERRSFRGVEFENFAAAEKALARLLGGEVELEGLGSPKTTVLRPQDLHDHPAFDRMLFDPKLGEGDVVPEVLLTDRRLMVGEVARIQRAAPLSLEDPAVRERAVNEVYEERAAPLRRQILEDLAR